MSYEIVNYSVHGDHGRIKELKQKIDTVLLNQRERSQ